ncbi:MAG: SDR family NAD(P)-dependent oxidoreductase [Acidimicrobiia bacterium]
MRVAITGGSGVVGAAVLRHLLDAGHEVRALARSETSQAKVAAAGATVVRGDLLDREAVDRLITGCDRVFHLAGINELCPADIDLMWEVNVTGTGMMIEACAGAGVGRLIHTSSAATIGERRGEVGRETTAHRGWYLTEYERSKHRAEQVALGAPPGLEVVVVNPSSVQGPGRATGTGRILLAAVRGRLPAVIDTEISIVDIDDCARGHLLAAERGKAGERYLINGATIGMREALSLVAALTGQTARPWMMPPALLSLLAWLVEMVYMMRGRRPPLCREAARVLRHGHRYDGSKASRELGLGYMPVAETLARTVAWFEEVGLAGGKSTTKSV